MSTTIEGRAKACWSDSSCRRKALTQAEQLIVMPEQHVGRRGQLPRRDGELRVADLHGMRGRLEPLIGYGLLQRTIPG